MPSSSSPRVSIGVPVYNGERYLASALDGILAQDFTDFEVVVSDNASTDATADIAQRYAEKDQRIRYHRNDKNLGAAPNYNQVVRMARGEYFKWHSHDDVCLPGFTGRCVEVLDADPGVELVWSRAAVIDDDGEIVKHYPPIVYAVEGRPSERARSMLAFESPCIESFGLMRREVLLGTSMIGPYTGSDRTLFLELAFRGRFHEIDEVLFYHRQHSNRSVHKFKDNRARNAWFDTSQAGKRTSPRWRLLRAYAQAVRSAPVPLAERVAVVPGLVRWMADHKRVLAGEAATSVGLPSIGSRSRAAA